MGKEWTAEETEKMHELYIKLMSLGATEEDIIKLWGIALETVSRMNKEA